MPEVSEIDHTLSLFEKSQKTSASERDADFDVSLGYRKVYIELQVPPTEIVQRAKGIISRRRMSLEIEEIGETTAQLFRNNARKLRTAGERDLIHELVPIVIPAWREIRDQKVAWNSNQLWCDAVPLPVLQLPPGVLATATPLPLPMPKPDLAFGYPKTAFNDKQLMAINFLKDRSGRSYAVPDKKVVFPFLDIEFKSAKNGTHFIATNQAANAGSVAMNGSLELIKRISEDLDLNEPQFFSLSLDHQSAHLNVHWLSINTENGQFSFHVEGLSSHFLNDVDGLRAVRRAVKNILDYGAKDRLQTLCNALDAYSEKVILEREKAIEKVILERKKVLLEQETVAPEEVHTSEVQAEPQKSQPQQTHIKAQLLSNRRQEDQIELGVPEEVPEKDESNESQQQLQGRQTARKERATVKEARNGKSSVRKQGRQHRKPSLAKSVRASSRLAAKARLPGK